MKGSRFTTGVILAAGVASMLAGGLLAQNDATLPMQFRATVMVLNAQPPGTVKVEVAGSVAAMEPQGLPLPPAPRPPGPDPQARVTGQAGKSALLAITIDRFSTDEETSTLAAALKSGGTYALVSAMEKTTVGYLHLNGDLRWPIRVAFTWNTEEARFIRLATNGPILDGASAQAPPDTDDPIGIIELKLPRTGRGEGTLVAATRAEFDDQGRLVSIAMPIGSGTQRLTNVERVTSEKGEGGN
jgi:hypothetical protein